MGLDSVGSHQSPVGVWQWTEDWRLETKDWKKFPKKQ